MTSPAWLRTSAHYPSWRLLKQQQGWWSRIKAKLFTMRFAMWASWLIGVPIIVYAAIFSARPDFAVVDMLLEQKSFTFYSDQAVPRPNDGGGNAHCASSVPGEPPAPGDAIGVAGASVPDVANFIKCAKSDLTGTGPNAEERANWGTSRNLIDALVAQEDRFFWSRDGINLFELGAGFWAVVSKRGGSNISMQLIKNLYFRLANNGEEGFFERAFRNLYARHHQAELEDHVREQLAKMRGVKPADISVADVRAAVLGLYLQTAHTEAPDPEDKDRQVCISKSPRLFDVIHDHPQCLDLMGVARIARRSYGKRLDQLTIAESATVVTALRAPRYAIPFHGRRGPIACEGDAAKTNACWAAHLIRLMSNDPATSGLDSASARWFGPRTRFIPRDQLPPDMARKDIPFITAEQSQAALSELEHLVVCRQSVDDNADEATRQAVEARRTWCPVDGKGSRADTLGITLASLLESDLRRTHSQEKGEVAVYTTLNPDAQRAAEEALRSAPGGEDYRGPYNGPPPTLAALVTLGEGGQIKAMVISGTPRSKGSPGSTLKPFVFGTHLQAVQTAQGAAAATNAFEGRLWANDCERFPTLLDPGKGWPAVRPGECGYRAGVRNAWLPKNAEDREVGFYGGCSGGVQSQMGSIREALCRSLNTVTAEVALHVGRPAITATMNRLGLHFPPASWNQAIIGEGGVEISPIDLASAYTVFLNGGRRAPWIGVRATMGANGLSPASNFEFSTIFSPEVTNLLRFGLRDVITGLHGTVHDAELGEFGVFGKTGTTQGNGVDKPRNIWFAGFQDAERREVTVVWLFYHFPRDHVTTRPVGGVRGLYGKDASIVYRTYLQYRAPGRVREEGRP